MKEEEKKQNDELTDEQANGAAGGASTGRKFTCKKCSRTYSGSGIRTTTGVYCSKCVPDVVIL